MTERKKGSESVLGIDIDFYTIAKDVLKNWWIILVLALSVALVCFVQVNKSYRPTYTIEATYVVTAKGVNNSVYDNLSTAQDTATKFSQIINSAVLRNIISEELGSPVVPGVIQASNVPETNLLTLTVTANSPQLAHQVLKAVMDNYSAISEYLVGNAIMDVLMEPVIPIEPDQALSTFAPVRNAFVITVVILMLAFAVQSYLKDTIRRSSDVEKKLDGRLLGTICHEEKNKTLIGKLKKHNLSLLMTNPIVSFRYAEMMRKTCRKVQNRMEEYKAQTLLVTSCLENEGKSTVAANLALSMASVGKKVILIDLDLRKPSQYLLFELEKETKIKLGHVFKKGTDDIAGLITHMDSGLDAIFNTYEYRRSTELLTTGQLEKILKELKRIYDYIIIDTPPMAYVADAEEIAHMVDASLVVVREHIANTRDINDMLDVLNSSKGKNIGCIFNDAHNSMNKTLFGGHGYGYGYGYGNYYGYYYGRKENQ